MSQIGASLTLSLEIMEKSNTDFLRRVMSFHQRLMKALGLQEQDLERLDKTQGGGGLFRCAGYDIYLRRVCIHPYGSFSASDGWQLLLLPVGNGMEELGEQGKTTWLTAVSQADEDRILMEAMQ